MSRLIPVMNLYKTLKNLRIDLMTQGTFLGGGVDSIDGEEMIYGTVNSGYEQLEIIFFDYYTVNKNDVIIDVGCGKGRVFNYLIFRGLKNKMIGYEINEAVGNKTKANLARYNNVEIRSENIFNNFPQEGNLFYLFNPFKEAMIIEFRDRILEMKENNPVILYYNPAYIDIFIDQRFRCEIRDIPIPQAGYNLKLAIIRISDKYRLSGI